MADLPLVSQRLRFVYVRIYFFAYVHVKYTAVLFATVTGLLILRPHRRIHKEYMINDAIQFIARSLNQALVNTFHADDELVVMNNVIQTDGSIPTINQNRVVVSLVNIEKETNKQYNHYNRPLEANKYSAGSPSEFYNLDLLFSANFDQYNESLKMLGAVIAYFQGHSSLTATESSAIPAGIKKIDLEPEKLVFHEMHNLWTAMGAKYQPSLMYKVRLLNIQSAQVKGVLPSVLQTATSVMQ